MTQNKANRIATKQICSGDEFENAIKDGVTLADFNGPWCAPCHSQEPILEKLAGQFQGKASIVTMNVNDNQDLAMKLGIRSIPTLIIFKNNKEVQRFVGLQPETTLSEALEGFLE
jgi:thioredoxin 1